MNITKATHLDLNAMNPPLNKLLDLMPIYSDAGYDTLMIGWEDKFPWKEPEFKSDAAFTSDEILLIQKKASENGLGFIPMIQCIGHMENFLHLPKYASLREIPERSDCINPLADGALDFVMNLLEEMLELSPDIKFIHIGGDEVWTMGSHPDTKLFIERYSEAKLYLKHIRPILDMLNTRGIRPLLWHDMMIKWDDEDLLSLKDDADIIFWGYDESVYETSCHYNIKHIKRFASLGLSLWGAGAYKGGSGPGSIIPDIDTLSVNARSWRKVAEEFGFNGLVATGWSRYSQFHFPCDPIYISLESLFAIGDILNGQSDRTHTTSKMNMALEKRGILKLFTELKTAAMNFAEACTLSWACLRNLHQQYVMEENFLKGKEAHIAKIMQKDFQKQFDKLQISGEILRKTLHGLANELDIREFIDTKIEAIRRIMTKGY